MVDGLEYRVPVTDSSTFTLICKLKKHVSNEELIKLLNEIKKEKRFERILNVTNEKVVSSDIKGDEHSVTIDVNASIYEGSLNLVKLVGW